MPSETSNNRLWRKDRLVLALIVALFILPLMLAWVLAGQWRPAGAAHHGELLTPARPVSYFQALEPGGSELDRAYLQEKWTLVYMSATAGCDESCRQALYKIRQIRLALGREMGRVQRLWLTAEMPDAALAAWRRQEHADVAVGVADAHTRGFFAQAFSDTANGYIYLIDPLANLVMRYPAQGDPQGMLKDLKRLLKLSKIG